MGVREFVEKNKRFVVPIFFGFAVALAAISMMNVRKDRALPGPIAHAYYSDDEGKSFFVDDLDKAFPFQRNGKAAFRAFVFKCDDKKEPFVGLLGRHAKSGGGPAVDKRYTPKEQSGTIEVSKPGSNQWVPFMSVEGQKLLASVCPSGRPLAVQPGGVQ